ncbi:hypothetical protein BKA67DRAFT_205744 [Truncatella angustata]|uniref:Uncharacterized protein n=1 Tax=Truncatella angustata TaxID=152316 RepID=A0A9P8UTH9_9PEZI|nr:uncharacterized protein BKA67DRAFT_205744 [Truncatella angustata]KAH6658063.1 hypothetical protein BKA67DRAFT_205744 [Truncatella angustata]KAH8201361.1 hypothetical protein TruAng_004444 [Truncatella angustata]
MCEKHYYSNTTRDGVREKQTQQVRCKKALRSGIPCENSQKFKHPEGELPASASLLSANYPPSPPSSDTSFAHSGSEGERSHKRRSGVYFNGEKVAEIGPKSSLSRQTSRRERRGSNHVVIVEPPKSPRTPPRYETPLASPTRSPTYVHERPYSSYYIRPEVNLEVNRPRRDSAVHYDYITPKVRTRRDSHSQGSGSISDEEARLRQLKREIKKAEEAKKAAEEAERRRKEEARKEAAARQHRLDKDIRRQNENIANRPVAAAPMPPTPLKYRRGSVSLKQPDAMLADAMRNTYIDAEKERRRREKRVQEEREQRAREEEVAQKERLRARMAPQRSHTTSHSSSTSSSRRPTVVYDDPYR